VVYFAALPEELSVGKDLDGTDRGLFEVVFWFLGGEIEENHKKP
jgi:hypothetical protein